MNRRIFLSSLGLGASGMLFPEALAGAVQASDCEPRIKPIAGAWFEFQHHLPHESEYWDKPQRSFTAEQWKAKIREAHEIGLEYLVLMSVALFDHAFYPTKLAPPFELSCTDPMEAVLTAADDCGIKFFISNGYWGDVHNVHKLMTDPEKSRIREQSMEEIAARYSHHPSFYGWYFPNEAYLHPYFDDYVVDYVNRNAAIAKQLMPASVNMIAPYNIKAERADDGFVKQLERMNIEIIAYQDGVGVNHTRPGEPARHFEHLHCAHQRASRSRIWADMELFYFEQGTRGNLMPADFKTRILRQMEDISPFVDKILCYQYTGILNKPDTAAPAGHRDSYRLWRQYEDWLKNKE